MIKNYLKTTIQLVSDSWKNRKITVELAVRDLQKQYKGTALGVLWALIQPLSFVFIYWFAIEIGLRGARNVGHDFPFILWLIPAIFAWRTVSSAIGGGGNSIRRHSNLVTKVMFPTITIPQFVVTSLFFVHIGLVLFAMAIFIVTGHAPTIYWLQLVYAVGVNFVFCLVVATFLSAFTAFSSDLVQLIKTVMRALFWFTPIIWPIANIEGILSTIIRLNPIAYIVETYRWSMIYGQWFWEHPVWTAYYWGLIAIMLIAAIFAWGRLSRHFADVL